MEMIFNEPSGSRRFKNPTTNIVKVNEVGDANGSSGIEMHFVNHLAFRIHYARLLFIKQTLSKASHTC